MAAKPILSDYDVKAILGALKTASERKRWLTEHYSDGVISEEQVAYWFYVYNLREA